MNHLYVRKVNEAIEATRVYLQEVVEKPDPAFAGFAPCPFARKERITGSIAWADFSFDLSDESIIYTVADFLEKEEKKVLLVLDVSNKISYKDLEAFASRFKPFASEYGLSAIVFHPDHTFSVGGVKTRNSPYPMLNIGLDKDFNMGYDSLRKTDYYSKWSLAELTKINRQKEFKNG